MNAREFVDHLAEVVESHGYTVEWNNDDEVGFGIHGFYAHHPEDWWKAGIHAAAGLSNYTHRWSFLGASAYTMTTGIKRAKTRSSADILVDVYSS